MIELHKITWVGGIFGILTIIVSAIKFINASFSLSQLILGVGLGCTMLCFTYIYSCLKLNDKEKENIKNRLDESNFVQNELCDWAKTKGFKKHE